MLFHFPQRNVSNIELTLKIDDHPMERVSDLNFLGTTITETLDWSHYIDNISNKVSRIIGIIIKLKNVLQDTHCKQCKNRNRLALNVNKSNCMLFQRNGNQNTLGNTLNIGIDPIKHKLNSKNSWVSSLIIN